MKKAPKVKTPDILETVYSLKEWLQVVYDIKDETFAEAIKAAEGVLEEVDELEEKIESLEREVDTLDDTVKDLRAELKEKADLEGVVWIKGLSMEQTEKVRQFILTEIYPNYNDEEKFHIP